MPLVPRTKKRSWSCMCVTTAVLTVTSKFFCLPEYCRIMVCVSSTSLSTPRFDRKKPVTEAGVPNKYRAWSIVWVPGTVSLGTYLTHNPGDY